MQRPDVNAVYTDVSNQTECLLRADFRFKGTYAPNSGCFTIAGGSNCREGRQQIGGPAITAAGQCTQSKQRVGLVVACLLIGIPERSDFLPRRSAPDQSPEPEGFGVAGEVQRHDANRCASAGRAETDGSRLIGATRAQGLGGTEWGKWGCSSDTRDSARIGERGHDDNAAHGAAFAGSNDAGW